ncbi:MAG TPA: DEAD/DEAH box helicase [Geminicoccus sp.]|uniref:DEAD/DEAH box helicase n=1 Tax=Geminicoccus sp. TaxID=2024832 RepID=UPI002C727B33|nr:DEAD/DEAH box helicase [Geminicoccus sp.]HWL69436.1 DEAD/DEAH box helicase [Geminicoccus sp.]
MTLLAPFQQATVDVAVEHLSAGARRFLVADEVGLGKTVIARKVAERLRRKGRCFNLLYLCPSLEIVGQNRPKLVSLTGIDVKEYSSGEDRLSLVPGALPDEGNGYRVFTFTPETSLPGWKPGPRTGRKAERAVIRAILDRYDALRAEVLRLEKERARGPLLPERSPHLAGHRYAGIERALRDVFSVPVGSLERAILSWLRQKDVDLAELIARFRSALALAALRSPSVRPDLIILDEFHRYADLILPLRSVASQPLERERAAVHGLLVDALLKGDHRPSVLLLSATPYRLRRLSGEDVHPVEHYRALVDLSSFLSGDQGTRRQVENGVRAYHDALRTEGTAHDVGMAVIAAKQRLESLLRPLMARTERALVHDGDLFERDQPSVEVEKDDLRVFRHFARSVHRSEARLAGWVPAMWSSIPYPAQTLHGYQMWKALVRATRAPVEGGDRKGQLAHPQLRKLAEIAGDAAQLSLPWQPPTLAWWKLEGAWAKARPNPGKTLLFSKWRAAPTAISALLSLRLTQGLRKPGTKAPSALLRSGGVDGSALIGLFAQWPHLSTAIEPRKSAGASIKAVRKAARDSLEKYLEAKGVRVGGKGRRPVWKVACGLEKHISPLAFLRLRGVVSAARGDRGPDWAATKPISIISRPELNALANHLLSAPGSVLARCAKRHGIPTDASKDARVVFAFAWHKLRGYLGQRAFADLLLTGSQRKRYPDALCEAILKGGFEAVLDEQMSILATLDGAAGLEIVHRLDASLMDRPGLVRLRRSGRDHRVPVQAIVPFAGAERRSGPERGGRLRTDSLRRAFNSPFWPHVLCTTSVGQEGLDFHLWCSRIIHWDLPSDPVDFEQREGRIARYASLSVRRSFADNHAAEALRSCRERSPFARLLEIVREQPVEGTGLEGWWLPAKDRCPRSVSFAWQFSHRSARRDRMLHELLLYRLALGQPDPDAFLEMLKRTCAGESDAKSLAMDLSAISRVTKAPRAAETAPAKTRAFIPTDLRGAAD